MSDPGPAPGRHWRRLHRATARALLPAPFVERWEEELGDAFARDLAAANRGRRSARFLIRSALDLTACALALHARRLGRRAPLVGRVSAWLRRRPRLPTLAVEAGASPRRHPAQEPAMDRFTTEILIATRSLFRRPGFLVLAVATLALGIGANTAIFSIVSRILLAPLPFPQADRLAVVYNAPRGGGGFPAASELVYSVLARAEAPFDAVAALAPMQVNFGGEDDPERITAAAVTSSFFGVARVAPALGRGFDLVEDAPGAPGVAVLGYDLWQRRFGGGVDVLGESVTVDGDSHRIVGVMPRGFELLLRGVEIWLPLAVDEARFDATTPTNNNRILLARTATDLETANAAMPALVERLRQRDPDAVGEDQAFRLVALREHTNGNLRPTLLLLLGAVGMVLLIACANVANLILVRCSARGPELALRAALGAGRARLIRLMLAESLVLAGGGAAAGCLLAAAVLLLVRPLAPLEIPIPSLAELDGRVLAFTVALTALTVAVCGLAPALAAARRALRGGPAAGSSRFSARAQPALVVVEVALATLLLIGSALLIHSLLRLGQVDPGFALEGRVVADLTLSEPHPGAGVAARLRELTERAAALPGVEAAGTAQWIPLRGSVNWGFEVEGRTDEDVRFADYNLVGPGAFAALGIPVLEGRAFTWRDLEPGAPPVVVVSSSLAGRLWPSETALGERLNFDLGERVWREVVGVVGEVRNRSLATPPQGLLYFPPVSLPFASPADASLVIATADADPDRLAEPLRRLVADIDPSAPLGAVASLRTIARDSLREQRFLVLLLGLFAATSALLSGVGLYGVLAHALARRTREIGVRMALGARSADVLRWLAAQTATLVGAGLALGLAAALALTRLLESRLYEVDPRDAWTYVAATGALVLVCAVAALRPARRAVAVDPVTSLRQD